MLDFFNRNKFLDVFHVMPERKTKFYLCIFQFTKLSLLRTYLVEGDTKEGQQWMQMLWIPLGFKKLNHWFHSCKRWILCMLIAHSFFILYMFKVWKNLWPEISPVNCWTFATDKENHSCNSANTTKKNKLKPQQEINIICKDLRSHQNASVYIVLRDVILPVKSKFKIKPWVD